MFNSMLTSKPLFISLLCSALLGVVGESLAAGLPQNAQPGALQNYEIQQRKIDPNKKFKTPKPIELKEEEQQTEQTPEPQEDLQKNLEKDKSIYVQQIRLEGNTLIPKYRVDLVTKKYTARELKFDDLLELNKELTALYRDQGYITSRVYLPPQKVELGILRMEALEGELRPIALEEGTFFKSRAILPRLRIDDFEKLNVKRIKNDLARLNENPDLGLSAVLSPGKDPGQTELRLKVDDRVPFHITPFFDNLGRDVIGKERLGVSIAANNLLGFGDRNTTTLSWTDSSFGVSNNYDFPIGPFGTRLGFSYARSQFRIRDSFSALDLRSSAEIYTPYISQEFFRNENLILSGDLNFDFKNIGTTASGIDVSKDRLRILRFGFNFDEQDPYGLSSMRHEFAFGFDVLGATGDRYDVLRSRIGSGGDFFRYTGFGNRVQYLPKGIVSLTRVIGQISPSLLNSAEQLQIGGAFTVRGFQEGQFIGDSGFMLSEELRFPLFFIPYYWRVPLNKYGLPTRFGIGGRETISVYSVRDNIKLVAFADMGGVFSVPRSINGGLNISSFALGVGAGLRVNLFKFLVARVDLGIPVLYTETPGATNDLVLHFGLSSELF